MASQPILRRLAAEKGESEEVLDFCFAYLDDCVFGGDFSIVIRAIALLRDAAKEIGLELNWDKCKLICLADTVAHIDQTLLPSEICPLAAQGFKLLGAPIGPKSFCDALTAKRVKKNEELLEEIGALPDPQVALLLLRSCASFGKIAFSLRSTPVHLHADALKDFDDSIRACFELLSTLHPNHEQWLQASVAVDRGGLGLRQALRHASPAYVSSLSSCLSACRAIDSQFAWEGELPDSALSVATRHFNAQVREVDRISLKEGEGLKQKSLSRAVDGAIMQDLIDSGDVHHRAHYNLVSCEGAGAWLFAMPSQTLGLGLHARFFITLLQRWLRMEMFEKEFHCPLCDELMDIYGDHALVCPCGGDRTKRHNLLRNQCARFCRGYNMRPEVEKSGLLSARMDEERLDGEQLVEGRRPADIFLPSWDLGGNAALDFAVTSGLKTDMLHASSLTGISAATSYETKKREYLRTADCLREEGVQFIPMVVEAHSGSWGVAANKFWKKTCTEWDFGGGP